MSLPNTRISATLMRARTHTYINIYILVHAFDQIQWIIFPSHDSLMFITEQYICLSTFHICLRMCTYTYEIRIHVVLYKPTMRGTFFNKKNLRHMESSCWRQRHFPPFVLSPYRFKIGENKIVIIDVFWIYNMTS